MLLTWRIVLFFLMFIGQFPLQYFLSTREGSWPGLVLPVLNALMGVVYALNATTVAAALAGFLLGGGIWCAIHLLLYYAGRGKVKRRRADQVDKMNIQDLG